MRQAGAEIVAAQIAKRRSRVEQRAAQEQAAKAEKANAAAAELEKARAIPAAKNAKKAQAEASAEASAEPSSEESAATGSSQSWAMLIKRVYEADPLCCPECGGQMKVVSFIEPRAPERSDGRG